MTNFASATDDEIYAVIRAANAELESRLGPRTIEQVSQHLDSAPELDGVDADAVSVRFTTDEWDNGWFFTDVGGVTLSNGLTVEVEFEDVSEDLNAYAQTITDVTSSTRLTIDLVTHTITIR